MCGCEGSTGGGGYQPATFFVRRRGNTPTVAVGAFAFALSTPPEALPWYQRLSLRLIAWGANRRSAPFPPLPVAVESGRVPYDAEPHPLGADHPQSTLGGGVGLCTTLSPAPPDCSQRALVSRLHCIHTTPDPPPPSWSVRPPTRWNGNPPEREINRSVPRWHGCGGRARRCPPPPGRRSASSPTGTRRCSSAAAPSSGWAASGPSPSSRTSSSSTGRPSLCRPPIRPPPLATPLRFAPRSHWRHYPPGAEFRLF